MNGGGDDETLPQLERREDRIARALAPASAFGEDDRPSHVELEAERKLDERDERRGA